MVKLRSIKRGENWLHQLFPAHCWWGILVQRVLATWPLRYNEQLEQYRAATKLFGSETAEEGVVALKDRRENNAC